MLALLCQRHGELPAPVSQSSPSLETESDTEDVEEDVFLVRHVVPGSNMLLDSSEPIGSQPVACPDEGMQIVSAETPDMETAETDAVEPRPEIQRPVAVPCWS